MIKKEVFTPEFSKLSVKIDTDVYTEESSKILITAMMRGTGIGMVKKYGFQRDQ